MGVADIRALLDDESLGLLDVTGRLTSWKGEAFDLYVTEWTFADFRPRDEHCIIRWLMTGRARALRVFAQDCGRLSPEKKASLFEIGARQIRPSLRVSALAESGALSTGLFLDLLDYAIDE